jgi:hypothetical protein
MHASLRAVPRRIWRHHQNKIHPSPRLLPRRPIRWHGNRGRDGIASRAREGAVYLLRAGQFGVETVELVSNEVELPAKIVHAPEFVVPKLMKDAGVSPRGLRLKGMQCYGIVAELEP